MKTRRLNTPRRESRKGFTLIELLVVISIIATLMALILPAIQQARATARKTECLNSMRQVGQAMYNLATNNRGRFPAYGTWQRSASGAPILAMRSWVVDTLPYLDRRDIFDRWNFAATWDDPAGGAVVSNLNFSNLTRIKALVCPDDTSIQSEGALSFVVNAGYSNRQAANIANPEYLHKDNWIEIDWDNDGNVSDVTTPLEDGEDNIATRRSGLCWRDILAGGGVGADINNSLTLDEIYDGAQQTIMLSENLNAGNHTTTPASGWGNPDYENVSFVWPVDATSIASLGGNLAYDVAPMDPDPNNNGRINVYRGGPEGTPFMSSNHTGGVNAVFCDGGGRFINDTIDDNVLSKIISASGTAPLPATIGRQTPLSEGAIF